MVDRRERFRGALLGLACGDALGAAVEGWSRPDIAGAFGTLRDFQAGPIWAHGETTDDTAQAVDLAESLLATAEFDPDDLMRRFVAWLRTGGKGIGITTHAALSAHIGGAGARDAARVAHDSTGGLSAGNGGLMRAAPVALRHAADPAAIADVARRQTAVTHFDPLAGHAAAAFCLGLDALLADGGPRDAHARAVEYARAASPELSERLAHAAEHEPNPDGYGGFAPRTLEAGLLGAVARRPRRGRGRAGGQPWQGQRHARRGRGRACRRVAGRQRAAIALARRPARPRAARRIGRPPPRHVLSVSVGRDAPVRRRRSPRPAWQFPIRPSP